MKNNKFFKYLLFLLIFSLGFYSLAESNFKNTFFNNLSFFNRNSRNEEKIDYYSNGNIKSKQFYINDKKSGIWKFYYEDGKIKSKIYFSSLSLKEEANVINFDTNGKKMSDGKIIDGEMVSIWNYYDENEKINHSFDYDNHIITVFNEEEKPIFSLKENVLLKKLSEIQKEIKNDRTRSFPKTN